MNAQLLLASILTLSVLKGTSASSSEDKLVSFLLDRIKPTSSIARPVADAKDNATISLGLTLVRISRVKDNAAELYGWLRMDWQDPRLAWDHDKFDGLSSVALPADLLWLPDIRPYTDTGYQPDKEVASRVHLKSSGQVQYVLPVTLQVNDCETLNNRSVKCQFSLGSWVYNGKQVDIRPKDFSANPGKSEWQVVDSEVERVETLYACCPEPFVSIDYKLMLNPKSAKLHDSKKSGKSQTNG